MAIFKCKMCGGDLNIIEGATVVECEYCGTKQTVPALDNEKKASLFARANRLRFGCEFDKAAGIYESIVAEFPEEAEAYWGLVLCKYGIEYVDDPATAKKIPTCHRSSFESVMDDSNFEMVLEYSDTLSRQVYREEAKQIEELRKGIIEVSSKEEPYDIFICYKETDEKGDRTLDSVIAQDVYDALCEKGYRVFFSRITLEDKLGQEYEPYIFAALNSAKIMLAFGSDYEYYNAVWVKNEWSRFLQLIEKGEKKTLIPCYKNIDAYDMPKEFAKLQAQDMGKVGAIQDLLRGIEKILPRKIEKETIIIKESQIEVKQNKPKDPAKQKKIIIATAISAICAIIAFVIVLNTVIIPNNKRNEWIAELKKASVGDYIKYGKFEQDSNKSNGKEEIEWLVLDEQDGKILVISKYILDIDCFNNKFESITWETCTMRKWLNDDFLNSAFSEEEKSTISTVKVPAHENPKPTYNTNPGNATYDKLFLLSLIEVEEYLSSDAARLCEPTTYAASQLYGGSHEGAWWWLLRTPSSAQYFVAYVGDDGSIDNGESVDRDTFGVRPAMWIDLDKLD